MAFDERWVPCSPAERRRGQVALYLDVENLVLGTGPALAEEGVAAAVVRWLCHAWGGARIRRGYADWADPRFRRYHQVLEHAGVDLIQVGHGATRKNAADIRIAVDAMEALLVHPDLDTVVVATGDSDFSPLVTKLREHGRRVVGVGPRRAASPRLASVCSEYVVWDGLLAGMSTGSGAPSPGPSAESRCPTPTGDDPPPEVGAGGGEEPVGAPGPLDEVVALVRRAFESAGSARATASALKTWMLRVDPEFRESRYGFTRFRELLVAAEVVREVGRSGSDIVVGLVPQPDGPHPATDSELAEPG
ncbi:NYN domain-containing protein [Actinoalloteichus sp. AHMU CJ021]|uniref:NYN domain-containing protein n=1 Tax=Actinoalloteichus sp. AHMU CJ021 TaxID=2072503 RepID=UPI000CA0531F|nr:NYN domain-containing protein [Actinoalloteichus sp. AHMU CJ021]